MDATHLIAATAMDVRAMTENIPSPCISVCRMDAQRQFCDGCWRTLDELRVWRTASDADKKAIWALIEARVAAQVTQTVVA
jgi:predicted Fe-S protein YdhL (DUF1289 family)